MAFASGVATWAALRLLAGVASAWVMIHISAFCLLSLAPLGRPILAGVVFAGIGIGIISAGTQDQAAWRAEYDRLDATLKRFDISLPDEKKP